MEEAYFTSWRELKWFLEINWLDEKSTTSERNSDSNYNFFSKWRRLDDVDNLNHVEDVDEIEKYYNYNDEIDVPDYDVPSASTSFNNWRNSLLYSNWIWTGVVGDNEDIVPSKDKFQSSIDKLWNGGVNTRTRGWSLWINKISSRLRN